MQIPYEILIKIHVLYCICISNILYFHSYCSYKNVLFMGQSDLDPRTIDLNLYGNIVPIRICCTVREAHAITGQLQYVLERVLHIDGRLRRNNSNVLMEMTSREHQYIEKMNVTYLWNLLDSLRAFFYKCLKCRKYSSFAYMLLCKLTLPDLCRVHAIVFYWKSEFRK